MPSYQVTIGYKAVISIMVDSDSEQEAKDFAVKEMGRRRDLMFRKNGIELQDDSFAAHGVLNMDETWDMVQS